MGKIECTRGCTTPGMMGSLFPHKAGPLFASFIRRIILEAEFGASLESLERST